MKKKVINEKLMKISKIYGLICANGMMVHNEETKENIGSALFICSHEGEPWFHLYADIAEGWVGFKEVNGTQSEIIDIDSNMTNINFILEALEGIFDLVPNVSAEEEEGCFCLPEGVSYEFDPSLGK